MTQVLTAQVLFPAKEWDTQYGPRLNAKIKVANGEEAKLWGPPGDVALLALRRGQTIQIAKDGKGKYSLVEQAPAPGQPPVVEAPPLDTGELDVDTKSAIASYITSRADLYAFCFKQASRALGESGVAEETIKCAASTLFISAQKKFGI
ncbi:hypothetical protein HRE53_29475 (plasmid) [Acaryochloris sp. 'Moss Beach']|uniref:hypothetical protein n=1 Tax=Acaryochloris sp. 'Moss Beach' TaxID=2740837 RepID=UPI001F347E0E|nr:hypothetical protein [Acaryochloris sp. 'Moss Beach']UJB72747.1 hypothetical protein HRE53_29475 [Acaryochloris sp. 'Moss Beach']